MKISHVVSNFKAAPSVNEQFSLQLYQITSLVKKSAADNADQNNFEVELSKLPEMEYLVAQILKEAMCGPKPTPANLLAIRFMLDELRKIAPHNVHSVADVALFLSASDSKRFSPELEEIFKQALKENTPNAYKPTSLEAARKEAEEIKSEAPSYWTRGLGLGLAALVAFAGGIALYRSLQNGAPKPAEPPAPAPAEPPAPAPAPKTSPSMPLSRTGISVPPRVAIPANLAVTSSAYVALPCIADPVTFQPLQPKNIWEPTCPSIGATPSHLQSDWSEYVKAKIGADAQMAQRQLAKASLQKATALKEAPQHVAAEPALPVCLPEEAPKLPDSAKQVMIAPSRELTTTPGLNSKRVMIVPSRELVTTPGLDSKQLFVVKRSSNDQSSSAIRFSQQEIQSVLRDDKMSPSLSSHWQTVPAEAAQIAHPRRGLPPGFTAAAGTFLAFKSFFALKSSAPILKIVEILNSPPPAFIQKVAAVLVKAHTYWTETAPRIWTRSNNVARNSDAVRRRLAAVRGNG